MKKLGILFFIALFVFANLYSQELRGNDDYKIFLYLDQEQSLANNSFSIGDTTSSIEHLRNITTYFQKNKKQCINNTAICDIIFQTYCTLYFLDKNKTQQGIIYLKEALSLVDTNKVWAKQYRKKSDVVNNYVLLIGDLIESDNYNEASMYNEEMVKYGETYYPIGLPDILLSACALNSLMGQSEKNYPFYKRLYAMFNELDKIQQYKVVSGLIYIEFTKENYSEVIRYAKLHAELINKSRDDVKESMLDFIGLSYCRYASLLGKKYKTQYEPKVNDIYLEGYEWARLNNKSFLPEMIICWAYYLYGFDSQKSDAIALFYEFLDCLQTTTNTTLMFEHTYYEVEDAQQALISIILADIIKATQPKDLDVILSRYDKVVPYLLVSGEFVQDLKAVLQLVYE